MEEDDKLYFQHQSNYLNNSHSIIFTLLGYLVPINLAFFAAIYILSDNNGSHNIWDSFNVQLKVVLSVIIALINFSLTFAFIRESYLNGIVSNRFYSRLVEECGIISRQINHSISNLDKLKSWTGRILNCMFPFAFYIPLTFIMLLFCSGGDETSKYWLIVALPFLFAFVSSVLISNWMENAIYEKDGKDDKGAEYATRPMEANMIKELVDANIKIVTTTFDKAAAYTNIIILAGYAGLFGLWKLTNNYLSKPQALWAALFILISLLTFVIFEVVKMIYINRNVIKKAEIFNSPESQGDPQLFLARLNEIDAVQRHGSIGFMHFWVIVMYITVATGLAASGILGFAFICGLIAG